MTAHHHIAAGIVALGLAASAAPASAKPPALIENNSGPASTQATSQSAPPTIVRITASNGFDWGDAGIGAGGGLALAMVGIGGALALSGRRTRRSSRSPAITS